MRRRRRTPLDDAFMSGVLTLFSMAVLLVVLFVGVRG
ncbi:hypothetical protein SO3561_05389 [Streptomyces olivochromogenes]|uniref:Uncharacterized protein n=1 Tax=Streptomyces olivochromogenes TaxID=1963 RepID=A0A250VII2_STROL|nr:hypothetical protein SO3561_05389 [Streptomyces olivochromogenes]